ncbi:MAG: glycosyltransferase family 4 protein [Solirubrobacterales bacterium]
MHTHDHRERTFWTGQPPACGAMSVNVGPVLLITPRWSRDGGVGTHVMASAQALARHGVDVRVLAARIESSESTRGVTLQHAPELFNTDTPPEVRLGDGLSTPPSVIHLHQFDDPDVVAFMRMCAPVVISAHGYTACTSGVHYFRPGQECTRSHGLGCVPNLLARGCAHSRDPRSLPSSYGQASQGLEALRIADLAISYSSAIDRHLSTNGLARRRVIPLFTTMVPETGSGHQTRRRVVFAGRIVAPKGVGVLIRAARTVDAEFVICGDGWRLDAMRRLARRLGVSERVSFKGWLGAEELAHELAEASVVVIPSVWPEPFGLVGIEALASGRPVIASLTGGIGDWLQDGVSGVSVTPGDVPELARALNEVLADPVRQAKMGDAGREMVNARFSTERHVAALVEAYGAARSRWRSDRCENANGVTVRGA